MRRIFIFPTIEEAKAFILTGTKAPVFVAGGSAAETAACIVRAVRAKRPHHLVLAGFAQLHDGTLSPETVVEVVTARDRTGCEEHLYQTTGPDLGLPLADGVVPGPDETETEGYGAEEAAPEAFEAEAAGEPNGPDKADGTEVADETFEVNDAGAEEPDDADDAEPLPKVGSREGRSFLRWPRRSTSRRRSFGSSSASGATAPRPSRSGNWPGSSWPGRCSASSANRRPPRPLRPRLSPGRLRSKQTESGCPEQPKRRQPLRLGAPPDGRPRYRSGATAEDRRKAERLQTLARVCRRFFDSGPTGGQSCRSRLPAAGSAIRRGSRGRGGRRTACRRRRAR